MLIYLSAYIPDLSTVSDRVSEITKLILSMIDSGGRSSDIITSGIDQFTTSYSFILSILTLIVALIGCFFGYKLSRLFMALSGFLAGFFIGILIASGLLEASNWLTILCGLAGGIILSLCAYGIYRAGIFILCFFLAFIAAASLLPLTGQAQFFACAIIGFIVGTLAIRYVRPVIICSSVVVCARSASDALMTVGPHTGLTFFTYQNAALLAFAGLCLLGILFQFLTTSESDSSKKKKR